jgi:hypothetical protein
MWCMTLQVAYEKYLQLPGNVLLTVRPNSPTSAGVATHSLVNIHSDVFATTDVFGAVIMTTLTGPFGEQITGQQLANNTLTGATFSYTGQHEKLTETFSLPLIQMGARVYSPTLNKLMQVNSLKTL